MKSKQLFEEMRIEETPVEILNGKPKRIKSKDAFFQMREAGGREVLEIRKQQSILTT